MPAATEEGLSILVIIPVFNDWASLARLVEDLGTALSETPHRYSLLVVDDGSTQTARFPDPPGENGAIGTGRALRLRRNMGHQGAIAVALSHVHSVEDGVDAVVIMDGDGEDRPEDVPRLIARYREADGQQAIFAERTERSEGAVFRICYWIYQGMHRLLTGRPAPGGNFSVLPYSQLGRLILRPELWTHYSATAFATPMEVALVPTKRGRRYAGHSMMNFVSLVLHGLRAFSVQTERIGTRVLLLAVGASAALTLALLVAQASPGAPAWLLTTCAIGSLLTANVALLTGGATLVYLRLRQRPAPESTRDHAPYVDRTEPLWPS